jgi:hypothetical protein
LKYLFRGKNKINRGRKEAREIFIQGQKWKIIKETCGWEEINSYDNFLQQNLSPHRINLDFGLYRPKEQNQNQLAEV